MSDRAAGINVTVPQELFGRLLNEARARDQALSAYASARFVAVMHGDAEASVTSARELDLSRQLREMTAKLAKTKNDEAAERQRVAALTKRVNDLVEKLGAAPAPVIADERLTNALDAAEAEIEVQRQLVEDLTAERDASRTACERLVETVSKRNARIAELEAEINERQRKLFSQAARVVRLEQEMAALAPQPGEKIVAAPAELSAITVRTIRQFASLGHRADWIARQTGAEVEAVRAVLKAPPKRVGAVK